MADRRMFSRKITESDAFYSLPSNAQALYFHLNMLSDDDGFINNVMSSANQITGGRAALKRLVETRFLLQFDSIYVIKHWRMSNSLKNDRMKKLTYPDVAKRIWMKPNRAYTDHPLDGCMTLFEIKTGIRPESSGNPPGIHSDSQPNRTEPNRTEPNAEGAADWFGRLWEAYPELRRGSKAEARTAYGSAISDDKAGAAALEMLALWKQSEQWAKDGGKYVPFLVNWLARGTWNTRPSKMVVPAGASGELGDAEIEAIQRILAAPMDIEPEIEAEGIPE